MICWNDLVTEATEKLARALGDDRRQEARWIVERISGYGPAELVVHGGEFVGTRSVAYFDQLLARRCSGEPLQYVLGRWAFRSLELFVDRNVLIPRPETEIVAGIAIEAAREHNAPVVVDLGTGSGAIAASVAFEVHDASVWACDISPDALKVARANIVGLGRAGTRVTVCEGDWYTALPHSLRGAVQVVVANPPYVALSDDLPDDVRNYEPSVALFGTGTDGRGFVDHIIDHAPAWLAPGGKLVLEMQPNQTEAAQTRATAAGFVGAHIVRDLADKPRALVATRPRG